MSATAYFAAPLFTQAERLWNARLANAITARVADLCIILPQVEGESAIVDGEVDYNKIYQDCLAGIARSDLVLAVLDGADSDSGTCFECGYAHALGKMIIGVRSDYRGGEDDGLNAMLNRSCYEIVRCPGASDPAHEMENLAERVAEVIRRRPFAPHPWGS